MLDTIQISQILMRFGGLSKEELADAMPVVAVCAAQCFKRLKKPEFANEPAVLEAAAAIANYRILLRSTKLREGETFFRAGEVSVHSSPAALLEAAVRLRDDCLVAAAPYLKDEDFVFAQV